MWDRLQQIYAEEVPVIGLYWRANPYILPKWLKGVRPTGQMAPSSLWVEDWTVEGRWVLSYLARRLAASLPVLAVMSLVIFLLIGLMPGDPIDIMIFSNP